MIARDTLMKAALFPVLIAQALWVRKSAQMLPEPPGPRAGTVGDGPALRLLILGDSSAAGVGAASQAEALSGQLTTALAASHRVTWRLEAKTGATTVSTLAGLKDIPRDGYDIALVVLGVNDITRQRPLSQLRAGRCALHDRLRSELGIRRIIASGIPPMGDFGLLPTPLRQVLGAQAGRFDAYMRFSLPLEPHLMASDGFHPSAAAYAIWARLTAGQIRQGMEGATP